MQTFTLSSGMGFAIFSIIFFVVIALLINVIPLFVPMEELSVARRIFLSLGIILMLWLTISHSPNWLHFRTDGKMIEIEKKTWLSTSKKRFESPAELRLHFGGSKNGGHIFQIRESPDSNFSRYSGYSQEEVLQIAMFLRKNGFVVED
ncbi:MAG: hypothetical protein AAF740_04350 [Bacteroidota bacterium]